MLQASDTIMGVDLIIVPVHLRNHWACAIIDLARKELVYYDSMVYRANLNVRSSVCAHCIGTWFISGSIATNACMNGVLASPCMNALQLSAGRRCH